MKLQKSRHEFVKENFKMKNFSHFFVKFPKFEKFFPREKKNSMRERKEVKSNVLENFVYCKKCKHESWKSLESCDDKNHVVDFGWINDNLIKKSLKLTRIFMKN